MGDVDELIVSPGVFMADRFVIAEHAKLGSLDEPIRLLNAGPP